MRKRGNETLPFATRWRHRRRKVDDAMCVQRIKCACHIRAIMGSYNKNPQFLTGHRTRRREWIWQEPMRNNSRWWKSFRRCGGTSHATFIIVYLTKKTTTISSKNAKRTRKKTPCFRNRNLLIYLWIFSDTKFVNINITEETNY